MMQSVFVVVFMVHFNSSETKGNKENFKLKG